MSSKQQPTWRELTDYIRVHFHEKFQSQAEGAGIDYKNRFAPMRIDDKRKPKKQEIIAILSWVEKKHGERINIDHVKDQLPPGGGKLGEQIENLQEALDRERRLNEELTEQIRFLRRQLQANDEAHRN